MRALGFCVFLVACSCVANAQTLFFQNFNLPDRNEPVAINILFQDKNGFIWMGTDNGLYQFDGFTYLHFTANDSLPDKRVTAIAQDSAGRIWTGHANGHLAYLEGGVFKKFAPPEGSATEEISDILFAKDGMLWFSTLNDGLYYYTNARVYRLDEEDGMPDLYIYDLEEGPDGSIWAGTDGGVARCQLKKGKAAIEIIDQEKGLPDNIVRKIKFSSHVAYLGTQDAGISCYDLSAQRFSNLSSPWGYGTVSDMLIKQDQIWVSCAQKGIGVIDLTKKTPPRLLPGVGFANTLLLDHEGGIWMGRKSELVRTPGLEISFLDNLGKELDQNIVALAVDHDENIWFSNGNELFKVKKNRGSGYDAVEKLSSPPLRNFPIISLHIDQAGRLWAGSFGKGALLLDSKSNVIHYFSDELRNGNILSICSRGNDVWFATLEGAIRITTEGKRFSIKNFGSKEGLSSDYIYQVFVDSRQRVWLATDGNDVDMLDTSGVHHFSTGGKAKVVYGFTEDADHQIWANVQGEGLYKLDQNKFAPFTKLRNNSIHHLTFNTIGNVVAVHDLGIEVIDVRQNKIQFFGEEWGIRNRKANLNAITQNEEGEIFVGTREGIIHYQPSVHKAENRPRPFVQKLKAGNKQFTTIDDLKISYYDNDITLSYLGFWYENPQQLNYQYQLENFDRTWINSKNHEVTYSRLPPGQYLFHLKVSDSDDFQNAQETVVRFQIRPPFWQQGWFYAVVIITMIYAVYLFVRLRERQLLRERRVLKLKVEERTQELKMRNEEVEAQAEELQAQYEEVEAQAEELQAQSAEIQRINNHLEELVRARTAELEKKNKALEEYAFINAHKLRSPVASILGLVNLMTKIPQTPESKEYTEHLESSAKALDEIVNSISRTIEKAD